MQNIEEYIEWLKNTLEFRLKNSDQIEFNDEDNNPECIFTRQNISAQEKFIALLSVAPMLTPQYFNNFAIANKRLPGRTNHEAGTFLPTIETAVYLLAGNNTNNRLKYLRLLSGKSTLVKSHLIKTEDPAPGLPFNQSVITPGTTLLNIIFNENSEESEFGHNFPAQILKSNYEWDELIVDYDTGVQLNEVKEWLQYEDILKEKNMDNPFSKGYKCLFSGPPGTGKTMAAALIGKHTGKKVYRIDLSSVVSKYIGETEKNLSSVFDRADQGNWILFFDEADALFGKRGATNNAHDRYANQEVSYLLQRFESYQGVSILATNYKQNIDAAFQRRFHSIVKFRLPENEERKQLWQVHLPNNYTYAQDIDMNKLAKGVKINGAGIHNVLRRCCMKATLRESTEVSGDDLLESIKMEFAKENKIL